MSDELKDCPACGATGLAERIDDHDCEAFEARLAERWVSR